MSEFVEPETDPTPPVPPADGACVCDADGDQQMEPIDWSALDG